MSQPSEGEHQAQVSATVPTLAVDSGRDCVLDGLVNGVWYFDRYRGSYVSSEQRHVGQSWGE